MVRPPFLFPAPAEASSLLNVTSGPGVAEAEAGRGPGYVTGVCLVIYAAAAASLGNVVQVVLRTVLYCTVLYCIVLYCGAGGAAEDTPRGHQQPPHDQPG